MSIDLDIAPRQAGTVRWESLRLRWRQRLGEASASMLGPEPKLRRIGDATPAADSDPLAPSSHFFFTLAVPCTLSLSVMPNEANLDETLYLEDYGRNLEPPTIAELAEQWRHVGYYHEISSGGGRSRFEPELFITLACALADLCEGHIIVMNDRIFDLDTGVYTPAQFSIARLLRE